MGKNKKAPQKSLKEKRQEKQAKAAELSSRRYGDALARAGKDEITTEITEAGPFYFAEDYHQQYLAPTKNPNGYCNHGPNGLSCPVGVARTAG